MSEYAHWYAELHTSESGLEVTRAIAKHMAVRIMTGNAVIVCDKPQTTLSVVKKRWKHILRLLENQQASTTSRIMKSEIREYLAELSRAEFFLGTPEERVASTVWITTPDELDCIPKKVTTVYVASEITRQQLTYWLKQIEGRGVVLLFRKTPLPVTFGGDGGDEN